MMDALQKFLRSPDTQGFMAIRGSFGMGKTLLVRSVLETLREQPSFVHSNYKYNERPNIFASALGPITKTERINGMRPLLNQMFMHYAARKMRQPSLDLLQELTNCSEKEDLQLYQIVQELFGLRKFEHVENFAKPPDPHSKSESQSIVDQRAAIQMKKLRIIIRDFFAI